MRVSHVCCVAPPEIGGMGRAALEEVERLNARGIESVLLAPGRTSAMEVPDPPFVTRLPTTWRVGNAAQFVGLRAAVRGVDLVHLHYPFYGTAESLLWRPLPSDPPIVMTFHMDAVVGGWRAPIMWSLRAFVQPRLLEHVRRIFVSSFDYARHASIATFFELHPDRVQELPFGVDTNFFSQGPGCLDKFYFPVDLPVFLFVGGLDRAHAFKGVPNLLRAFAPLANRSRLLIVGDGDLRGEYEDEALRLGIRAQVSFVGRLSEEDLRDAYRTADVFVFPSTSPAEAFGLAAIEAEACAAPVIASDLPGVRTVVRDGETGILVDPNNRSALHKAMEKLLHDKPYRLILGEAARRFVMEKFSWQRHMDDLVAAYEDVCTSRS